MDEDRLKTVNKYLISYLISFNHILVKYALIFL